MSAFMLYVLLVSLVVSAAALLAERAVAAFERPIRGVWLAALLASAAVPFVVPLLDVPQLAGAAAGAATEASVAAPSSATPAPAPASSSPAGIDWRQWAEWAEWSGWRWLLAGAASPAAAALNDSLFAIWIAGAVLVLIAHAAAWFTLRRALDGFPRARIDGTEVAVSDALGPAVFGIVAPRIVVPKWLLGASSRMQAMVLRHERAHIAARDTWWLGGALLAVALVPWNPLMWWQLKRLRAAVELDCDARVVRGGTETGAYARMLLAVARRRAALPRTIPMLAAVGSTASRSQLERRVRRLLERRRGNRIGAVLCGAIAAGAFAAAFAFQPPEAGDSRSRADGVAAETAEPRELEREPLTGLAVGGERVVVLVDASATMLDRTADGVARRLSDPPEERRYAPKWQHVVETVESLTWRIPSGASFQIILFADDAHAALPGTDGRWLTATRSLFQRSVDVLREDVVPGGRSDLRAAFAAARALEPPPDIVHLVVDGLPNDAGSGDLPADERERMALFQEALESMPDGAAVNVLLMPKAGDSIAAPAYWTLAHRTGGALLAPVEGATRSPVLGVPLDAEYLIFIVDTSGSMRQYAGDAVLRQVRETLDAHPSVKGIQVLNDEGMYLFADSRGEWIADTPALRQQILERLRDWSDFSNSSPREGIVEAIETFHDPQKRISVYVIGDDLAAMGEDFAQSAAATLEAIDRVNRDTETDAMKMRIHAVAMPVYLDVAGELLSAAGYAFLMRELTLQHGGAFIALPSLGATRATPP